MTRLWQTQPMTQPPRYKLLVCVDNIAPPDKGCCGQKGSVALAKVIAREVAARGVTATAKEIVCLSNCHRGPSMRIAPGGRFFFRVNSDQLPSIRSNSWRAYGKPPVPRTTRCCFPAADPHTRRLRGEGA